MLAESLHFSEQEQHEYHVQDRKRRHHERQKPRDQKSKSPPPRTKPWLKETDDDGYVWIAKSAAIKKSLRQHGAMGDYLPAARMTLRWHVTEAKLIKKYISKALNEFTE